MVGDKSIKIKYPRINLGSASIVNKQSIEDSLKIGLNFSMMKFWDKDLFNYAQSKNYLLSHIDLCSKVNDQQVLKLP